MPPCTGFTAYPDIQLTFEDARKRFWEPLGKYQEASELAVTGHGTSTSNSPDNRSPSLRARQPGRTRRFRRRRRGGPSRRSAAPGTVRFASVGLVESGAGGFGDSPQHVLRLVPTVQGQGCGGTHQPTTLPVRTPTKQSAPLVTTASGQRVMARIVGAPRLWTLNSIGVVDSHWGFSYFSSSVSRASSPSA